MSKATLYDQDFLQLTQQQAECLRKGHWVGLDIENLVEELETLGRSEQKELGELLAASDDAFASVPVSA